ncbi:MAG: PHP domain-containing protein [Firmicutes bacterium]|nr:PHP domain-containing protein [Bacillota bacterium]
MPFKTELHMHTNDISVCSWATPEQAVAEYKEAGYRTIVVTNHMNRPTFKHMKDASWQEKMQWYVQARKNILQYASENFTILLGFEICMDECSNDYLVYGATDDFFLNSEDLMSLSLKEFRQVADANNLLVYQAHPFRHHMTIKDEKLLDGVEVFNGELLRHDSHNFLAMSWANYTHLAMISGSDYHRPGDLRNGGILTEQPITTEEELLATLMTKNYKLLRG